MIIITTCPCPFSPSLSGVAHNDSVNEGLLIHLLDGRTWYLSPLLCTLNKPLLTWIVSRIYHISAKEHYSEKWHPRFKLSSGDLPCQHQIKGKRFFDKEKDTDTSISPPSSFKSSLLSFTQLLHVVESLKSKYSPLKNCMCVHAHVCVWERDVHACTCVLAKDFKFPYWVLENERYYQNIYLLKSIPLKVLSF